jgi:hypothetical protein
MSSQKILEIVVPIVTSLLVLAFIIGYIRNANQRSIVKVDHDDDEDHV